MNAMRYCAAVLALLGVVLLANGFWIPMKAVFAFGLIDHSFQKAIAAQQSQKPWSWADFNVVGKLVIKGEQIHVMDRATGQALAFGAGRHEEYDEKSGPLVLSGHRDSHFSVLEHIKIGDEFSYRNQFDSYHYKVIETRIFDLDDGIIETPEPDEILLITCWPFHAVDPDASKRLLVLAMRNRTNVPSVFGRTPI